MTDIEENDIRAQANSIERWLKNCSETCLVSDFYANYLKLFKDWENLKKEIK